MGFYINPPDGNKTEWLRIHGREINADTVEQLPNYDLATDSVMVCLVYNPGFVAAAICNCEEEKRVFAEPDGRAKYWYYVPHKELEPYLRGCKVQGRGTSQDPS